MILYRISRSMLRFMLRVSFRFESIGTEHIVDGQKFILCSNHNSNWDPPIVGTPLQVQVHYMAKEELFRIPGLGWLIRKYGTFPVNRDNVGKQTIQTIIQLLRANKVICIFPEGSRNSSEARRGAATFALKTNTPVVPVAIVGNYRLFSKMKVIYGKPIHFDHLSELGKEEQINMATQEIMNQIHKLMEDGKDE